MKKSLFDRLANLGPVATAPRVVRGTPRELRAELLGGIGGAGGTHRNPSFCLQHVANGDGCGAKADDCLP